MGIPFGLAGATFGCGIWLWGRVTGNEETRDFGRDVTVFSLGLLVLTGLILGFGYLLAMTLS